MFKNVSTHVSQFKTFLLQGAENEKAPQRRRSCPKEEPRKVDCRETVANGEEGVGIRLRLTNFSNSS